MNKATETSCHCCGEENLDLMIDIHKTIVITTSIGIAYENKLSTKVYSFCIDCIDCEFIP